MSTRKIMQVLGLCLVIIAALGTTTALPEAQSPHKLALRLLVPNPKSCLGSEGIAAEIALRNTSNEPIKVLMSGFGSGIHYRAFSTGDIHSPGLQTLDLMSDPWPIQSRRPKQVNLGPGESYWADGRLVLNHEFFSKPGIYAASIDFTASNNNAAAHIFEGALESNWVYFEVEDFHSDRPK
jgi:hypothetical protein